MTSQLTDLPSLPFLASFQFVFACLLAVAAASAIATYSTPYAYTAAAAPYAAYSYGAYPYSAATLGYKPLAYSQYSSPLTYTSTYKPLAYSAYNYGYPYGFNQLY